MPEVYTAISAVASELCTTGISKDQFNQSQKFKFRGIDDTLAAVSALLVKHKLVILPQVTSVTQVGRDGTNKQGESKFTMHTTVNVNYTFVSVKDGSSHLCAVAGEAADSGDKGVAKALSMAFKYLIFQAFAVPTEGQDHDPDAHTVTFQQKPKADNARPTRAADVDFQAKDSGLVDQSKLAPCDCPAPAVISEAQRQALIPLLTEAKVDVQTFFDHYKIGALSALPASQFDTVYAELNKRVGEARADRVLAGDAPAATQGTAESKPAAAGTSQPVGDSPAGGASKPSAAKVGPKVSRFRGVR